MIKEVGAGIIVRNGKILIGKRPKGKPLADFWEFPGGKQEANETIEQCLIRELKEELGIEAVIGSHIVDTGYQYPEGEFRLHVFFAHIDDNAKVTPVVHQALAWVTPQELDNYQLPPADVEIISVLKKMKI